MSLSMKKYWSVIAFVCWIRISQGEKIQDLAYNLSSSLTQLFYQSTGYGDLVEIYSEDALGAEVISVNGSIAVNEMYAELFRASFLIQSTLQSTISKAEELYSSHANTGCCSAECDRTSEHFDQIECSNVCNRTAASQSSFRTSSDPSLDQLPNLTYNSLFNTEVNLNESAILVPINIFVQDTTILCFTEWSANLTESFISAWDQLMKLYVSYIYIGDESGAMRIYPALEWGTPSGSCDACPYNKVDTFDPRHRPWYVNSVLGNKYVVILIDQSGSMTGTSSTIARLSTIELIVDMAENDFFIAYRVSGDTVNALNPYEDNSNTFLRASRENKLAIAKLISDMGIPMGKADFTDALNAGYEKLMNSSGCHKLIYIFSDGQATFPVKDFTNIEGVSVFTFLVDAFGKDEELRTLGCSNRGVFTCINGFNQIYLSVQVLIRELNRRIPKDSSYAAISQVQDVLTNSLIISYSIPSKPSINNETQFTGVLSADITENFIQQTILEAKLGSIGYALLLTNNGQLYSHPLLYSNVFKPGIQTYDFYQYEFLCNDDGSLRAEIINKGNGYQDDIVSYATIEHKKRYLLSNFSYYYQKFPSNVTIVAMKLPSEGVKRLNYSTPLNQTLLADIKDMLENVDHNHVILIMGLKPYCFGEIWYTLEERQGAAQFLTMVIEEVLSSGNTSSASCSPALYEPILRDLINVYQIVVRLNIVEDAVSTFFRFTSGLLYCVNGQQDTSFICSNLDSVNFLAFGEQHIDKISVHRGTEGSVLFDTVHLLRPIVIPSAPNISLGIAGIVLNSSFFDTLVLQTVNDSNSTLYLVDSGGYVVGSSNEFSNTTSFLGSLQPNLFNQLVNNSVFTKQKVTGYHKRLCTSSNSNEKGPGSAGNRLSGLLITLVNMTWQIMSSFIFVSMQSVFYYLAYGYETPFDSRGDDLIQNVLDLCVSDITFYMLDDSVLSGDIVSGQMDCDDIDITFQVLSLPNTSLIAVLYDNTTSPCQQELEEEVEIGERETRNYPTYYYSSAVDQTCVLSENYTDAKECSSSHIAHPCWIMIMIITISFIVHPLLLLLLL